MKRREIVTQDAAVVAKVFAAGAGLIATVVAGIFLVVSLGGAHFEGSAPPIRSGAQTVFTDLGPAAPIVTTAAFATHPVIAIPVPRTVSRPSDAPIASEPSPVIPADAPPLPLPVLPTPTPTPTLVRASVVGPVVSAVTQVVAPAVGMVAGVASGPLGY